MRYLLDTCVIAAIQRRQRGFEHIVARLETAKRGTLYLSAMTALELWYGAAGSRTERQARKTLEALGQIVRIAPLESRTARRAFDIHLSLIRAGRSIGKEDALIAAHALDLGAVCVSQNVRHFDRVPGLVVENWLKPV